MSGIRSSVIIPSAKAGMIHSHARGTFAYHLPLPELLGMSQQEYGRTCVLDLASPLYAPDANYIEDRSLKRNHGTITGGVWQQLPSGLWYPNLAGGTINCGSDSSLNLATAMTLVAWIKLDVVNSYNTFFSKKTNGGGWFDQPYWLVRRSTEIRYRLLENAVPTILIDRTITVATAVVGRWEFIAATWDSAVGSNDTNIYYNGSLVDSASSSGVIFTDTSPMILGNNVTALGSYNGAIIPEMFNVALTAAQILQLFRQTRGFLGV